MSDWQSKTYTVTVPANTTNHADDTVFGPSLFNILKIKVTQDTAGATFSLRTFKDAAHSKQLINLPLEVAPLYQPRDRTGGAPGTEGQEGRPFPYDDEDGLGELHTQWDNNDSADHVYTITVIYYELPLMSAGGGPTYRGAGSFLTSVALRGAGSGVVTIAAASAAGTWTWTVPTGAGTDQYGLITNGAGVSSWAAIVNSLSGTTNQIAASASTGTPTLSLAGPHNFTTQTVNGVLYGNGTGVIASTAQGAANSVLIGVGAGAPQFSTTPTVTGLTVTPSTVTHGLLVTAMSDATTYGMISFNGAIAHDTSLGIYGGGGTDKSLYINAPTAGTIRLRINGVDQATLDATSLVLTPTAQIPRLGLGAAADGTALINMNGTLVHGSSSGITIGGTTISSLLNLNEGNLRLTTASIAKFIGFYQSATQDWTIQHNADRSLSIDSPGSRVLALNPTGGVVTIQTDPGGSDALRVGGTVRALRLGLGAAADGTIPFLVNLASGEIAATYSGPTTGAMYQRWTNTGGSYYYGLDSSTGGRIGTGTLAYSFGLSVPSGKAIHLTDLGLTTPAFTILSGNVGIATTSPTFLINNSATLGGIHMNAGATHDTELHLQSTGNANSVAVTLDTKTGAGVTQQYAVGVNINLTAGQFSIADLTNGVDRFIITSAGSVSVPFVGPHAIGGATSSDTQWLQTGSFSGINGFKLVTTLNLSAGDSGKLFRIDGTLVEAGSGIHGLLAGLVVAPSITNGAATATDVVGIDVSTIAAGAGTTNATAIRAIAPTGASTLNDVAKFLKSDGTTIVAQFKGSGAVLMPSLATAGVTETYAVCADSNFQLILDTTACLVSTELAKKDIRPLDMGLATVLALEPVAYFRQDPGQNWNLFGEQIGFNANRAALVDERLITRQSQNGDIHSFRYAEYTAVLTRAIQEHHAMIKALEQRLEGLAA